MQPLASLLLSNFLNDLIPFTDSPNDLERPLFPLADDYHCFRPTSTFEIGRSCHRGVCNPDRQNVIQRLSPLYAPGDLYLQPTILGLCRMSVLPEYFLSIEGRAIDFNACYMEVGLTMSPVSTGSNSPVRLMCVCLTRFSSPEKVGTQCVQVNILPVPSLSSPGVKRKANNTDIVLYLFDAFLVRH